MAAQRDEQIDPLSFPALAKSKPFQRWYWGFQQRAYPLGEIPEGAYDRALRQIHLLDQLERSTQRSRAGVSGAVQPSDSEFWVNIGPSPIQTLNVPYSGRVADIAVDPSDPSHWLVGAAQGGLWQTRDAGATWSATSDSQASLAMGAIAFAPGSPNIVYAGTGEAVFSGDSFAGGGILKSTDGGSTWQPLNPEPFAKASFSDIRVHPTNSDIVIAATSRGTSGRGGGAILFPPATGILKSTDGGLTWSVRRSGRATDLEVHPANFDNQYAGIGEPFGNAANGVYRSTDAGDSWTLIDGPFNSVPGGVGRIELAIAPSDPNVLYVSIQDSFDSKGNDGGLLGIWRTDNAWDAKPAWTQLPSDPAFNSEKQWWYDHDIVVDPANPSLIFLGGVSLRKFDGTTWTNVTIGIHLDQQTMAWAADRLIIGNDGGIWSSTDGGSSWSSHNTNLVITQFYAGSLHPTDPNFALGGSQDNGTERWNGGAAWPQVFGGDGGDSAVSFTHPDEHWIVSFQRLGIVRTLNGNSFMPADRDIDKTGAPFIGRINKCPCNDDVVLAGTDNLWRSSDFFSATAPSWSGNGPEMRAGDGSSVAVTAIAFAPADVRCATYACGTSDGRLMLTANAGASWTDIDRGNAVPDRYITEMAFDSNDPNVLYVALSGYDEGTPGQPGHVFKTTNALSGIPNWLNVSPPVNIPHDTIVLDHFAQGTVYAGTDAGVFKSTDGGTSWVHHGPEMGMPNVAVFNLQINHVTGKLFAFTHGRGAFVSSSVTKVDPAPVLTSATLSLGGKVVEKADAGLSGLSVAANGSGFRPDTEITINGLVVTAQIPPNLELASRQRIVQLDQNPSVKNSAGSLIVRARNVAPVSEASNVVVAGILAGPEIASIRVKPKATGFDLKIAGSGFQEGATVSVLDPDGRQVPVRVVAFIGSDSLKAKIREGLPTAGTVLRVRVISPTGIRSNEMTVTAP